MSHREFIETYAAISMPDLSSVANLLVGPRVGVSQITGHGET